MKRLCLWTTLIAVAFVLKIQNVYKNVENLLQFDLAVAYIGNDVPKKVDVAYVTVAVSSTTSLATMASTAATAVRTEGTARGYSIAAGQVFLPSFSGN